MGSSGGQQGGTVNSLLPPSSKTANYILAVSDASVCIETNSVSALTITVAPASSVSFPVGTLLELCRMNTGSLTVVAGSGVTIHTPGGLTARAQYSTLSLRYRGADDWVISGDLA